MNKTTGIAIALMVSAAILFSTLSIFAVHLNEEGVSPWAQTGVRLSTSLIVFVTAGMLRFRKLPIIRDRAYAVNGFFLLGGGAFYLLSLALGTPPVKALMLAFLFPVYVIIFARLFLKESLQWQGILAVVVGLAGIAIVLNVWEIGANFHKGDAVAVIDGMLIAGIVLAGRYVSSRERTQPQILVLASSYFYALSWLLLMAIIMMVLKGLSEITDLISFSFSATVAANLAGIALISTTIPFSMMYMALEHINSSTVGVLLLLEPVGLFVLSALLLDDPITQSQILGGLAILAAGVLVTLNARQVGVSQEELATEQVGTALT